MSFQCVINIKIKIFMLSLFEKSLKSDILYFILNGTSRFWLATCGLMIIELESTDEEVD